MSAEAGATAKLDVALIAEIMHASCSADVLRARQKKPVKGIDLGAPIYAKMSKEIVTSCLHLRKIATDNTAGLWEESSTKIIFELFSTFTGNIYRQACIDLLAQNDPHSLIDIPEEAVKYLRPEYRERYYALLGEEVLHACKSWKEHATNRGKHD